MPAVSSPLTHGGSAPCVLGGRDGWHFRLQVYGLMFQQDRVILLSNDNRNHAFHQRQKKAFIEMITITKPPTTFLKLNLKSWSLKKKNKRDYCARTMQNFTKNTTKLLKILKRAPSLHPGVLKRKLSFCRLHLPERLCFTELRDDPLSNIKLFTRISDHSAHLKFFTDFT